MVIDLVLYILLKVKFWAAKTTKIIKILDLLRMLTSTKHFVEFQCFDKKMTQSMFYPQKHQSKVNINVRKQKKVELDNSM